MRKKISGFVTVRAISGTHIVFLAFDMKEVASKGLISIATPRRGHSKNEAFWLRARYPIAFADSGQFTGANVYANGERFHGQVY